MNVLVLGDTGFIGNRVERKLHTIKDINVCGAYSYLAITPDLRNYHECIDLIRWANPDIIFNCASHGGSLHYVTQKAGDVIHDNMQMSLMVYQSLVDLDINAHVVNPISNCAYYGGSKIQKESEFWNGDVHPSVSSFASAKRALIKISECYNQQYDIKTTNLIFPNAYGVGDATDPNHTHALNGMIIRMILAQINEDPTFEIWGTGLPRREWIYIDDFVDMLIMQTHENRDIPLINVAQNISYSITDIANKIKQSLDYDVEFVYNTQKPDGDPIKQLDDSLFREYYHDFSFTPINEGIAKTVAYYKEVL